MEPRTHAESVTISRSADELYDLVSDVTRSGEWSPICTACWWDEGAALHGRPQVGDWFTGRNETPERTWETRSLVVTAERGREFAFVVGGSFVRWAYAFDATAGGTRLTESWEFLPEGIAMFHAKYGDDADTQIAERTQAALHGIPATLAAIKRIAESG